MTGSGGEDRILSGWGRTAPSRATLHRASSDEDVRRSLLTAPRRGALARGLGRSYGDVAQNAGGTVIDMRSFRGPIQIDEDGNVRAEAGTSVDDLLRIGVPRGWFPTVTPGTRWVTLGGAIANDVHGKNHHVDGSLARHLVSFELMTPDGHVRTVTRDSDPTAWTSTVGGLGLTGVILRVTLRMRPISTSWVLVESERAWDIEDLMARMADGDERHRYSVAWVDCLTRGSRLGRGVLTRGDHATPGDLDPGKRADPLSFRPRRSPAVPSGVPLLVSLPGARALNEAWYRRAPVTRRTSLQAIGPFFYPLDAVSGWNRLYGRSGFVQHQSVVPFGHEETIVALIERLAGSGHPTLLGVLKRFGAPGPEAGLLSFPLAGWTLAVDLHAGGGGLARLLDGLDRLVADAGGRVYLAKDARLDRGMLPAMYPDLDRWRDQLDSLDPEHVMRSDLERRLAVKSSVRARVTV